MRSLSILILVAFFQAALCYSGCEDGYEFCNQCDESGQYERPQPQPSRGHNTGAMAAGVAGAAAAGALAAGAVAAGVAAHRKSPQSPQSTPQQPYVAPPPSAADAYTCNWCIRPECKPGACKSVRNFNALEDAKQLEKAMKGLGTTESVLIDILIHRSEWQIQKIRQKYQTFGRVVETDIQGDTRCKIKELFMGLLQTRAMFFAEELHEAFNKKNSHTMMMILTSVSPCAIQEIGSEFYTKYNKNIFDRAKAASMFEFEDFLKELIKAQRDPEGNVDIEKAKQDATWLQKSESFSSLMVNKEAFIEIFTKRSYDHIKQVKIEYEKMGYGNFKDEMKRKSGNPRLADGLVTIIENIEDQPKYFSDLIHQSLTGTLLIQRLNPFTIWDNDQLRRVLRGRCGLDLGDITESYQNNHGNLVEKLKMKAWGDYETAVVTMVTEQGV